MSFSYTDMEDMIEEWFADNSECVEDVAKTYGTILCVINKKLEFHSEQFTKG